MRLQIRDPYLRVEGSEIEQRKIDRRAGIDPIQVMGTADAERGPP